MRIRAVCRLPGRAPLRRAALSLVLLTAAACSASTGSSTGDPAAGVTATSGPGGATSGTRATGISRVTTSASTGRTSLPPGPRTTASTAPRSSPTTRPSASPRSSAPTTPSTATSGRSTAPAPAHAATGCAQRTLAGLTAAQLIGQLLMIGVPAADPLAAGQQIGDTPVGGLFLADRTTRSAASLAADIAALQRSTRGGSAVPLHISVDQEGGFVQTLTGDDFPPIPTAVEQGSLGVAELASLTRRWATRLAGIGITLDLAPVADTVPAGTESANPPIGEFDRQYGSAPDAVGTAVEAVISAMHGAGLGATVKHFPGLGRVTVNTDTATTAVDDQAGPDDPFLRPFRAGIAAGATAVMISSARYPGLDPDNVAAFSRPIISGLLRQQLKFHGLVISDDLGNAAAVQDLSPGERAVAFVRAGGDMVLTVRTADLAPMTAELTQTFNADKAFRARVRDAALHVLASKDRLGLLPCSKN